MYKKEISEALKHTWAWAHQPESHSGISPGGQDREISLLIHNIFGGKLLKTKLKRGWHFYNYIDGERLDFSDSPLESFEDIPSTPEEVMPDYELADSISLNLSFSIAFEKELGLNEPQS
jgi:hypothetical protein